MRLLAADIGGTKILLAVADATPQGWRLRHQQRYDAASFDDFLPLLETFIRQYQIERIDRACLAVAGPISADGRAARVTNLDWQIRADQIASRLTGCETLLINDFSAVCLGIDCLEPQDIAMLQAGESRAHAPRVVVGAGTGLGVGQQVWLNDRYVALASEGGHADFAPNGALQRELLAWLERQLAGHVSYERVLSGSGLVNVFRFLCERFPEQMDAGPDAPPASGDLAAWISAQATAAPGSLAAEALDLFIAIYGAQAGNLALLSLPHGGLYIAGGIAPRIIDHLRDGRFIAAFNDKGRMSALTARIPVGVIMNPAVGLLGALQAAAHGAGSGTS